MKLTGSTIFQIQVNTRPNRMGNGPRGSDSRDGCRSDGRRDRCRSGRVQSCRRVFKIGAVECTVQTVIRVENARAIQFVKEGFDLGVGDVEAEGGTLDFNLGDFQFPCGGLAADGDGNVVDAKDGVVGGEFGNLLQNGGLERYGLNLLAHNFVCFDVVMFVSTLRG